MLPDSCFQSLGGLYHILAAAPAHEMVNNISSLVGGNAIFKTGVKGRFCCKAYLYLTHEMVNNISSLVGGNAIFKTGLEGRFCCKAYLYLTPGVGWSYLLVDLLLERFRSSNAYPWQLQ